MAVLTQGYNHATLLGEVSAGPWHNPGGEGKAESAAFSLGIPEATRDSRLFTTYVRVECYGRTVADTLALHAGDVALVDGKLSWQRGEAKGDGKMQVTAWRVLKLASDLPATG